MSIKQLLEKLNEISVQLKELQQDNQILRNEVESIAINEMAQLQGGDTTFFYYTLDNEALSHYPHVHICVKKGTKGWQGKQLHNGSPYITVGSVRLLTTLEYTADDMILETVIDEKIQNNKYKKIIAQWLNSKYKNRQNGQLNCIKCLDDYLTSNSKCQSKEQYEQWLEEICA